MKPLRLAAIIGTRPEAIKLMPLILAARAQPERFVVQIVRTGQHRGLVDQLMVEFGLKADFDLAVMRPMQDLATVMSASVLGLSELLARQRPDWVLVQGDTTTTFAGALAAFYNRIPIGHVEAGLRTGNLAGPFPEEANRMMTAAIATLHFAPTPRARDNLRAEGIADAAIVVVGNTGIDALRLTLEEAGRAAPASSPATNPYILVTVHRRESHGAALVRICDALSQLLASQSSLTAWISMHPSPSVRSILVERLGQHPRVRLTDALGYRAFVAALEGALLVLTDSGGIQEECAALGKPVLVMRDETERPEAVAAGVATVVGTGVERIVQQATRLLGDGASYRHAARPSTVFGEGRASSLILDALWRHDPTGVEPVAARVSS